MAKPYWCSNPACKTKAPGKSKSDSKSVFDSINWRCRGCLNHVHLGRGLKHARDMIGRHIYTCFGLDHMFFAAETMSTCDKILLEGSVALCNQKFAAKEYLKQGLPFLATSAANAHGVKFNSADGCISPPNEVAHALSASDQVVLRGCIELCKHNLAAGKSLERLLASSASSSTTANTNAGRTFNCEDGKSHSFSSGHEEEASVVREVCSFESNAPPNVTTPESKKGKPQKEVSNKVEGGEQRGDKGKRKKHKNKAPSKGEPAAAISTDIVSACSVHQGALTPELHTEVSDFFRGEEPNLLRDVQPCLPVDACPPANSGVQTLMSGMSWAPTNLVSARDRDHDLIFDLKLEQKSS